MEDAHAVSLDLGESHSDSISNTFFAVYDGHGGIPPHALRLCLFGVD